MKNTYHNTILLAKPERIIVTLIGKSAAMMCAFLLLSGTCLAQDKLAPQKTSVGISLRTEVNADGYGGRYLPGLFISKGRKYYGLNAVIQTRNTNLAGIQFNYNYSLTGETVSGDRSEPELYVTFATAYHHRGMLGKRVLRDERMANEAASECNLENLCFRSVEVFAGFGLKLELFKNLKWSNSIGIGGYTSLYAPAKNLYYEPSGLGIRLSSGFSYSFN